MEGSMSNMKNHLAELEELKAENEALRAKNDRAWMFIKSIGGELLELSLDCGCWAIVVDMVNEELEREAML
jgi:hypothetical protein